MLTDCSGMRVSAFLGCWQTNQTLRVEEISHIKGQGKLPYSHDNREGGIENIKVKHDLYDSEHEMPKFKIFITKI